MKHQKEPDIFEDEKGHRYHLVTSGGDQTISLYSNSENKIVFTLDYRNSLRMYEFLEKSIEYLETEEEE